MHAFDTETTPDEQGSGQHWRNDDRRTDRLHIGGLLAHALALAAVAATLVVDDAWHDDLAGIALTGLTAIFMSQLVLRRMAVAVRARQRDQFRATRESREQIGELFAMTDMLQAAETYDDASAVLMATARRLLPDFGAALYIFNNSRDRLDLAKGWDLPDGYRAPETLSPANCWALKRGKPHINAPQQATLCCAHHGSQTATVELPMMACGQVHGLLILARGSEEDALGKLIEIRRLGQALADSMSLALSNIALREKLRTQSLRDPLTGLYNRRYMEDALERFVSLGARGGGSTAVVMLDLDNFKALNDEHGHAKGDAVLRDVAAQLVGALRPTDVVCRYGGEELLAILPDCSLEDALEKSEVLRERIELLSDVHGCRISASFGVAAVPEAATSAGDVVPLADGALYAAKKAGKNQVIAAERRAGREGMPAARLAVTGAR
ncbi:GGDEF domain-containing protein [Novosphingobium sp. KCTC 2891]|uniref:sensor domain-containing diguanylate cyclase n=1 Tax=Novosphingobium sp. KCTC 2891 TaxID=2989730 RepID=UPI0022234CE5|nr:GGDEF domain-containing protein [Novosphingobium sp. KCTC 2891]MCW1382062.1 GGDEF domain-containing protein [Novosphingobium sp. KCTC 2891]